MTTRGDNQGRQKVFKKNDLTTALGRGGWTGTCPAITVELDFSTRGLIRDYSLLLQHEYVTLFAT
jgi:hypothetical protein